MASLNLKSIDSINYLNIFFMVASLVAAQLMPFEVFLISYAVLGPAHYLTEISWLHDRKYYCPGTNDILFFLISGILLFTLPFILGDKAAHLSEAIIIGTFLSAAVFISPVRGTRRALLIVLCFLVALMVLYMGPLSTILALYLPTLIHVFLFTGLFVLYGALKSKSTTGYLSFVFFVACGGLCFPELYSRSPAGVSEYTLRSMGPFQDYYSALVQSFGFIPNWDGVTAYMRFMAFSYTYHYLNWFSKTKVIEWHKISPQRIRIITSIYLTALLLYAVDFTVGLIALLFLSLLHVILEFPLNMRAFAGLWRELQLRVSPR